jgi:hypothetical protein
MNREQFNELPIGGEVSSMKGCCDPLQIIVQQMGIQKTAEITKTYPALVGRNAITPGRNIDKVETVAT